MIIFSYGGYYSESTQVTVTQWSMALELQNLQDFRRKILTVSHYIPELTRCLIDAAMAQMQRALFCQNINK